MSNLKIPRWKAQVNRANGSIEFDRLRLAHIKDFYNELKEAGKKPSLARMELIVLDFILQRDKKLGIKSRIESITLEPDK